MEVFLLKTVATWLIARKNIWKEKRNENVDIFFDIFISSSFILKWILKTFLTSNIEEQSSLSVVRQDT